MRMFNQKICASASLGKSVPRTRRVDPPPADWRHLSGAQPIGDPTVGENVELPLTYRDTGAPVRKGRVAKALERVGLTSTPQWNVR